MLYFVQPRDNLSKIAMRFGTTVQEIMNANVICNPSLIFTNQPLIIPERNIELPKAGAGPYYVVMPGDSLYSISMQTGIPIGILVEINDIQNPNAINAGTELILVEPTTDDPEQLKIDWERSPDEACMVYGFTEHGVYYNGSFEWAAFRGNAIDYLLELLENPCDIVRRYAVISLGRIALNGRVRKALIPLLEDEAISNYVKIAIRRIDLSAMGWERVHVTFAGNKLFRSPNFESESTNLPEGTEIIVLRWSIPSPTAEEGPRGGLLIYDYVQVAATGQIGFLARSGFNEITFI
jgi:LysM repeat protein